VSSRAAATKQRRQQHGPAREAGGEGRDGAAGGRQRLKDPRLPLRGSPQQPLTEARPTEKEPSGFTLREPTRKYCRPRTGARLAGRSPGLPRWLQRDAQGGGLKTPKTDQSGHRDATREACQCRSASPRPATKAVITTMYAMLRKGLGPSCSTKRRGRFEQQIEISAH